MVTFLLSDIDAPVSQGAHGNEVVDQLKVDTLLSFGFQEEIARKALKASVKILLFVLLGIGLHMATVAV
jgi:ubiquitin carboxyl-terminal hydrolase 5/13